MNRRTAMVVGATGLIGSQLLQLLLNTDYYRTVISLGRKDLDISHPNLVKLIADFDRLEDMAELINATDVFCCLGTTMATAGSKEAFYKVDYTYPLTVAQIAISNNSENFYLVSALGANKTSRIYYNKVKGEIEEAVKAVGFNSVSIFRPSLLLGERKELRKGEKWAQKISASLAFVFVGPLAKYKAITGENVAKGMLAQAKKAKKGIHIIESSEIAKLAQSL